MKQILDDIVDKLPDEFNMAEIMGKVEDRTPYVVVAFQVSTGRAAVGVGLVMRVGSYREEETDSERL